MAKRSAADLTVVAVVPGERIAAPDHLTTGQRREWQSIVDSLPADYFRAADVSLLGAYCVAAAMYRQAAERIEAEGMLLEDAKGRQYPHPGVTILNSMGFSMAQMATKLRLCPQARYDPKAAAAKVPKNGGKSVPWAA